MSRIVNISLALMVIGLLAWMNGCTEQPAASADQPPPIVEPAADQATYWPIGMNTDDGELVMYQPQPTSLVGDMLSARAAVSWTPTGGQMMYGTAEFQARIVTDRDTRMVTLQDINSLQVHLPGAAAGQEQQFATVAKTELSGMGITFPLDQLLSTLDTVPAAADVGAQAKGFNNDPPKIIFSYSPATLITVNGPPRILPVDGHPGVQEVVNTPFIMLYDPAGKRYYLKAGPRWVSATDITGDWKSTADVPAEIAAAGDFLATPPPGSPSTQPGAASNTPGAGTNAPGAAPGAGPTSRPTDLSAAAADTKIIVSTSPAELIVLNGQPQWTAIPGGQVLYASNSDANLFLYQTTQKYYLLLAGRWYVAPAILGPWQYLPAQYLPADFANIPSDSPRANVLADVPNTLQAREAVLDAEIPQTASVRRDAGKDLNVTYDGQPRFQPADSAAPGPVNYAVNTPYAVLELNGVYYCCDDAVWYQSNSPTGPWVVCTSVPQAIYSIPPSCPDYYTTYCYVYDALPDYVYCGYLPGYTGCYVEGPCVVYGTGFNYGGWYGSAYFPYPCTWGFCAQYDLWAGDWGFGFGFGWGTGWFAHHWHDGWWRDHWRQVGHRDPGLNRWWGPHGYVNYNRLRSHDDAARLANVRGEEYGGRGRQNIYQRPRNVERNVSTDNRRFASAMPGRANDLYAGRDGQVYRRTPAGWETRSPGDWTRTRGIPGASPEFRGGVFDQPGRAYAPSDSGMQRDYAARYRGDYRANTVHSFGEYRGGGGGFRGGGGGGGFHGGGGGGGRR